MDCEAAKLNTIGSQGSPVTPEVWDQQEMRDALARRDISSVYRLLRRHGVSQRQIAALTGQSQSEVSEILKGRQVMAYDVLTRIAQGLGVPRGYMGLAYDEATAVRVAATADSPNSEEDESVKRRKFLAHAAAVTVGAAVLGTDSGSWVSNPTQTPAPGRIGMTDVRQVEAATRALRALDYQYGGGSCRDAVVAQLSWGQQMLGANATDLVRERLFVALADLHNLAGWTSFDTGLMDSARNHFGQALDLAKQGRNEALVANILYRMGRVYLHQDAPDDALKVFQLGQLAAQNSGSELAVGILCANEAWAYAKMGSDDQAIKLLGRARDEFARANVGEAPAWAKFFTEIDLSSMIGTVHTELAQTVDPKYTRTAIPALSKAINSFSEDMTRSRSFNFTSLAINHLIEGDVDHGTKVGRQAIDLSEGLKSVRTKHRMKPLLQEADKRRNNPDARELADRLAKFTGSDTAA
jgi:transcriptional regulator with XRE-family HTH domain